MRSISKKRFRLQASRLHVPSEQLLAVADECLRVQHRRVLENANARVQQRRVVELLRRGASPVVRVRRNEQPDTNSTSGCVLDPLDHPAVCDVGVDDVECLGRGLEQARDRIGDRPVPARRVVQHASGNRASLERREEGIQFGDGNRSSQPAEAGEKDELELGDDRAGDAQEQVVEATVLEVVLDSRAARPSRSGRRRRRPCDGRCDRARPGSSSGARQFRAVPRARATAWRVSSTPGCLPQRDGRRSRVWTSSGSEPFRSTTSRTGTPSAAFVTSVSANSSPTRPGRKPNWLMCTEDAAARMSSSMGG